MRKRYYPHLIHEFYRSLAKGDGWVAIVQGISIMVSDELLAHVWGISHYKPTIDCLSDKEASFGCILERENVRSIFIGMVNHYLLR